MKANEFKRVVGDFQEKSLKCKTTTSVLLISANHDSLTTSVIGFPRQIRDSLVTVLVDNPGLVKTIDGACRRARAIIKENESHETTDDAERAC